MDKGIMTRKITIKILDMQCPNCSMILEQIEDKLDGVHKAEASYHKGQMLVEYNESQVSEEQIRAAIVRLGYMVGDIIS